MEKIWYVLRGNQNTGPYSWEEVVAGAQAGNFHFSDYLWKQGLDNWVPVNNFEELSVSNIPGLGKEQLTESESGNSGSPFVPDEPIIEMPPPIPEEPIVGQAVSSTPDEPVIGGTMPPITGDQEPVSSEEPSAENEKVPEDNTPGKADQEDPVSEPTDSEEPLPDMPTAPDEPDDLSVPAEETIPAPPSIDEVNLMLSKQEAPFVAAGGKKSSALLYVGIAAGIILLIGGAVMAFSALSRGGDILADDANGEETLVAPSEQDDIWGQNGDPFLEDIADPDELNGEGVLPFEEENGEADENGQNENGEPSDGSGNGGSSGGSGDSGSGGNGDGGVLTPTGNPVALLSMIPENPWVYEPVTFIASNSYSPNGSIVHYAWETSDGMGSSGWSTSRSFQKPGHYWIKLTVTDNLGKEASSIRQFTVRGTSGAPPSDPAPNPDPDQDPVTIPNPDSDPDPAPAPASAGPVARFTYSPRSPFVGTRVVFDASTSSSPNGAITLYTWTINGTNVHTDGIGHMIQGIIFSVSAGTYQVALKVTDVAGETAQTSQVVTVRSLDQPDPIIDLPRPQWPGLDGN